MGKHLFWTWLREPGLPDISGMLWHTGCQMLGLIIWRCTSLLYSHIKDSSVSQWQDGPSYPVHFKEVQKRIHKEMLLHMYFTLCLYTKKPSSYNNNLSALYQQPPHFLLCNVILEETSSNATHRWASVKMKEGDFPTSLSSFVLRRS